MKRTANTLTVAVLAGFLIALVALLPNEQKAEAQSQCGCLAGPAIYAAKLTQSGTGDPVATVAINTLGGEVVWHRNQFGTGEYYGVLENAFPETQTSFSAPVRDNSGDVTTGSATTFTIDRSGDGAIYLYAYGEGEDGIIGHREIEGAIYVRAEVFPTE